MDNYDIILLQEHMLRDVDVNLITFCSVNVNFNLFLVASEHNGIVGHPVGGIAILTRSSLNVKTDLGYSMNKRVKAVSLDANGVKRLVFNVSLLCLDSSSEYDAEIKTCSQFIYNTIDQSNLCDAILLEMILILILLD